MGEYVVAGSPVSFGYVHSVSQDAAMISGNFYEATYDIGPPGAMSGDLWKTEMIPQIQANIENTPGCYFRYAYVEPNGQMKVQWYYDDSVYGVTSDGIRATAAPIIYIAAFLAAAVLAVLFAYIMWQTLVVVKEGIETAGPTFDIAIIAGSVVLVSVAAYIIWKIINEKTSGKSTNN